MNYGDARLFGIYLTDAWIVCWDSCVGCYL